MATTVVNKRFSRAAAMARRRARKGLTREQKMHMVLTKVLPYSLYGTEHAKPSENKNIKSAPDGHSAGNL